MSRRLCWSVVLLMAAACGTTRPAMLLGPAQPLTAEDYPAVLKTWTRSAKMYKGLESKLFVSATFHAPELRRAFAIAFPEIYGHGGEVTRRELVDLTGNIEQYNNLFLAVYTPNPKWNDLAQTDSIWRLTLIGSDEVAVGPAEVVPIKIDENLRAVYPYLGRFDKGYVVRFPQSDPMKRVVLDQKSTGFKLRIASALGVAEMEWELVLPPDASPADDDAPPPSTAPES